MFNPEKNKESKENWSEQMRFAAENIDKALDRQVDEGKEEQNKIENLA